MKDVVIQKRHSSIQHIFLLAGISWTLIIVCLLIWGIKDLKEHTSEILLSQARSFFALIVTTRHWNSMHGGVYAPITSETQPNPYLDIPERDIKTEAGKTLTLINPAYMTRQISELASSRNKIQFHITSLNPVRPDNAASPWETKALTTFLSGENEYFELWENPAKTKQYFRYLAPLWTVSSCLKCHAEQDYSEGDLRGGISVTIPIDADYASQNSHIRFIVLAYALLFSLGLSGIIVASRIIRNKTTQQEILIDQLQQALKEVKTLEGYIPICSSCKKIRADDGYWHDVAVYVHEHSGAEFSHGVCPDCMRRLYPDQYQKLEQERQNIEKAIGKLGQANADDISLAVGLSASKTFNHLQIMTDEKLVKEVEIDGQYFFRLP